MKNNKYKRRIDSCDKKLQELGWTFDDEGSDFDEGMIIYYMVLDNSAIINACMKGKTDFTMRIMVSKTVRTRNEKGEEFNTYPSILTTKEMRAFTDMMRALSNMYSVRGGE